MENLTNKRYGKLIVVSFVSVKYISNHKRYMWLCKCDCGKEKIVPNNSLQSNHSRSCGCQTAITQFKNLAGKVFNKLTVIKYVKRHNRKTFWLCKCDCGKETIVDNCNLQTGHTKSCGCLLHGNNFPWARNRDPIEKLKIYFESRIRTTVKSRKLILEKNAWHYLPYSPEELKLYLENKFESWMTWDNYGGRLGDGRKTWHIDHIKPQSNFVFSSPEDLEFKECWALNNLQPLDKYENLRKRNN